MILTENPVGTIPSVSIPTPETASRTVNQTGNGTGVRTGTASGSAAFSMGSTPGSIRTGMYEDIRGALASLSVATPPPPDAFRGLTVGPNTSIEIWPNEQQSVEGSNALLRGLSPFMLQVELPLVFGQDGGFTNQSTNNIGINTYEGANGVTDLYAAARSSVAKSGLGAMGLNTLGIEADPNPTASQMNKAADSTTTSNVGSGSRSLGYPAIADQNAAMDIASQLITVLNTPPLVLLINPNQMTLNLTKVQSYQDRTRYGYIFYTWGEEQPKLSINTKCGAFISGNRGVQFASKNDSAAWQNLMNALRFFKHNGYIHDMIGKSNANHFVGALSITYDGWIYYGHMESFSWNFEEASTNGGIDFSIEFTVSRAVDTSKPIFAVTPMASPIPSISDPRYQSLQGVGSGPGVYSIGADGISSMGHDVGWSGVNTLVPEDLGRVFSGGDFNRPDATEVGQGQPVGTNGFYVPSTGSSERTVGQSSPGVSSIFQLG